MLPRNNFMILKIKGYFLDKSLTVDFKAQMWLMAFNSTSED